MSTSYNIYKNDGAGGPVDYGVVVATTAATTWDTPALAMGSDNKYAVRASDTVTSDEEKNVDAVVRILVDTAGADVTGRPAPPDHLSATPRAGGGARVQWSHPGIIGGSGVPQGFRVYLTLGGVVNYGAPPAATVPYFGPRSYASDLTGLVHGSTYSVGIRAYNATATETNTLATQVVGDTMGPDAPESLTATAVAEG